MESLPGYDAWKTQHDPRYEEQDMQADREHDAEVYFAKAFKAWGASVASDLEGICAEYEAMTDGVDLAPLSTALYEIKTFFNLKETDLGMRLREIEYAEEVLVEAKMNLNIVLNTMTTNTPNVNKMLRQALINTAGAIGWLRHSRRRTG